MSVEMESPLLSRDDSRSSRHVRLQETPEYIPMLNQGMLHRIASGTPTGRKPKKADSESEATTAENERKGTERAITSNDMFSTLDSSSISLPTVAKIMVQTKKAAQQAKSRCDNKAKKMLLKQASIDSVMFQKYSLSDVHNKIKRQRQLRIAFLQKQFLDELPKLAEKSVKEHIATRIKVLENLKKKSFMTDRQQSNIEQFEQYERPNSSVPSRRQSILRKSIDMSNCPLNALGNFADSNSNAIPRIEDLEKLLAIAKSREKIEHDLDLPADRLQRLGTLRQNVDKINEKFKSLKNKNTTNKNISENDAEKKIFYAPSRFTKVGMAKSFFRRYVKIVVIVQQWIKMIMHKRYDFEKELKSFVDIASDIEHQTISSSMLEFGLSFDRKYYKANKEISLSTDVRKILTTRSEWRTPEMIKQVMNGLQSLRSLSEYPVQTQEKLCQVAWYQTIGPKKLIIRQGHHAQAFYFILSGTAFVKKMTQDPVTGESKATVAARLTRGHSFGEIGLLFDTLRTATVESATAMELLVIGKEDFIRIFMKAENPDDEPDHIKFLKNIPFMKEWPMEALTEEPGACLVHYFKRGALITENDKHSEWIYIVMSGSCEVLKKLRGVKGRAPAEIRPKSHPLTDIILPELGMPNNHPKIDNGKRKHSKVLVNPDIYRTMTEYYDGQRRRVPSSKDLKAHYRPGSLDNVRTDKHFTHTDVFVKVELLQSRNTFGLNTLKYCMDAEDESFEVNSDMEPPILSLVSCGAEVIMLSKKVFLKYADQKCRTNVRDQIKVYPSETILQDNMQAEADWSLFKNTLLEGQLKERKIRERLHSSWKV